MLIRPEVHPVFLCHPQIVGQGTINKCSNFSWCDHKKTLTGQISMLSENQKLGENPNLAYDWKTLFLLSLKLI